MVTIVVVTNRSDRFHLKMKSLGTSEPFAYSTVAACLDRTFDSETIPISTLVCPSKGGTMPK